MTERMDGIVSAGTLKDGWHCGRIVEYRSDVMNGVLDGEFDDDRMAQ